MSNGLLEEYEQARRAKLRQKKLEYKQPVPEAIVGLMDDLESTGLTSQEIQAAVSRHIQSMHDDGWRFFEIGGEFGVFTLSCDPPDSGRSWNIQTAFDEVGNKLPDEEWRLYQVVQGAQELISGRTVDIEDFVIDYPTLV